MRALFLTLFLLSSSFFLGSCLESNPQPSPAGRTDVPGSGGNENGVDSKGGQNPADGDMGFDGAWKLDVMEYVPGPCDAAGEVTDVPLTDGHDDETFDANDGGAEDTSAETTDLSPGDTTADVHANPDEMSADIVIGDSQLRGGGTYFGECWGACKQDVTVDGDHVNFVASNWDGTIYVDNDGTLTAAGLAKSKELAAVLVGVDLEAVYGCPDCADGGGAYVLLRRNGIDSQHDYPFGQPFTALTGCDGFVKELMTALAGCQSTDNIVVGDDCGPLG